jgi:hypothetical protein
MIGDEIEIGLGVQQNVALIDRGHAHGDDARFALAQHEFGADLERGRAVGDMIADAGKRERDRAQLIERHGTSPCQIRTTVAPTTQSRSNAPGKSVSPMPSARPPAPLA